MSEENVNKKSYEKTDVDVHGHLAFGTYEEAKKWIGKKGEIVFADDQVDHSRIKYFCSVVENGNPSHWDEDYAKRQWGGILLPPALLIMYCMHLLWQPEGGSRHAWIATQVPLPGETMINVSTESQFYRPVIVGDWINYQEEVVNISEEKTTALGLGHFINTLITFRNQRGEVAATVRNTLFRYKVKKV